jgi:hypothetical protein
LKSETLVLLAGTTLLAVACSRTGLTTGDASSSGGAGGDAANEPEPVEECAVDGDCVSDDACTPAFCHAPDDEHRVSYCATRVTDCDDFDPCTLDACNPSDGRCTHEGPEDADHDGVVGKAREGTPASCGGADCDDDDPRVFAGARELCDGKDDNCDGRIDEGASYGMAGAPVRLVPNAFGSETGGFAFDGTSYGVTYTETTPDKHTRSYFALLDANGGITSGPSRVNEINADAYGGTVATSGKSFLTTWADARQSGSYEVYATRFDQQARKLEPDQRLSYGSSFSLNPVALFTGQGYAVVWNDQRYKDTFGNSIFGRKLGLDGHATSDELRLTGDDEDADSADAAASETRLGVVYVVPGPPLPDGTIVRFRSYDLDFGDETGPVELGSEGQEPSVVGAGDYFVVAWHTGTPRGWGQSIEAVTLDTRGNVVAMGAITTGDAYAKTRSLVSLGDRILVVWSAIPAGGLYYELFYEIISARDLSVLVPRQLLVGGTTDLTGPVVRLGPNGDVGVLYDDTGTSIQTYFTHLGCKL